MFGRAFYGAAYFAPRYFGDGGDIPAPEPEVEAETPAGRSRRRRFFLENDDDEVIEIITRWISTHLGR